MKVAILEMSPGVMDRVMKRHETTTEKALDVLEEIAKNSNRHLEIMFNEWGSEVKVWA